MKFTIDRGALVRLLSTVIGATDAKGALPALSHILLTAADGQLTASATDMYISATSAVECDGGDGAACFPGRDFLERVKAMPAGSVTVAVKDNTATVKADGGARKFTLHTMPAEDFTKVPPAAPNTYALPAATLAGLINLTAFSVSTDETRPHVNSLLLEMGGGTLRAVSTDGHRLTKAEATVTGFDAAARWLLPLRGLTELRRLLAACEDDATVSLGSAGPSATITAGPTTLTIKLVDATFPPYAQVIPKKDGVLATVGRAALLGAIDAVKLAASDRTGGVKVTLAPGLVRVNAESPEGGNGADEVCAECESKAPTFGINSKYLADVLKALATSDTVTLGVAGELDPVVVRPVGALAGDFISVLMPMRI